jgi:hypothetical protein
MACAAKRHRTAVLVMAAFFWIPGMPLSVVMKAKIIAAAIGTNTEQSRASREPHGVDRWDARLKTKVPSLVPVFPLYSQAGNSEVHVPVAIH